MCAQRHREPWRWFSKGSLSLDVYRPGLQILDLVLVTFILVKELEGRHKRASDSANAIAAANANAIAVVNASAIAAANAMMSPPATGC